MALINKQDKINAFIAQVVNPALGSVQFHAGNVDTGGFSTSVESLSAHSITPGSFNVINPLGGRITASDLAALFQIYAYRLTSIRQCQLTRLDTPGPNYPVISNGITALSQTYCMAIGDFNNSVIAAPNPLTNLRPTVIASEAALDALIARLASICANHRAAAVNLTICHGSCHSSCHGSCHGSRGRR